MESELHLQATAMATTNSTGAAAAGPPRITKPPPQLTAISAPFSYTPSQDGTDENLLILLHGLGSHRPFFRFLTFIYFHDHDGSMDGVGR